ncbi:hypothetical protein L0Y49_03185 [bacterium]|nr:hypothetical protein [bacterium]
MENFSDNEEFLTASLHAIVDFCFDRPTNLQYVKQQISAPVSRDRILFQGYNAPLTWAWIDWTIYGEIYQG